MQIQSVTLDLRGLSLLFCMDRPLVLNQKQFPNLSEDNLERNQLSFVLVVGSHQMPPEYAAGPVAETLNFHCRGTGSSLIRELRSHMPRGMSPKLRNFKKKSQSLLRRPNFLGCISSLLYSYKVKKSHSKSIALSDYPQEQIEDTRSSEKRPVSEHELSNAMPSCMYIQSTSWEMPGWMSHKLESRLQREIFTTSDMQMTPS